MRKVSAMRLSMIDYYVIELVDSKGSGIRLESKPANHAEQNIRIIGLPQPIDLIYKNEESSRNSDLLPSLFPAHLSVLLRISLVCHVVQQDR